MKAVKVTPNLLAARVEVASGSTDRAFMQVWHKLHNMLWFGACTGGIRENSSENKAVTKVWRVRGWKQ